MPGVAGMTIHNLDLINELPNEVQSTARKLYFKFESLDIAGYICLVAFALFVSASCVLYSYLMIVPPASAVGLLRLTTVLFISIGIGRVVTGKIYRKMAQRYSEQIMELANESLDSQCAFALLIEKVPMVRNKVKFHGMDYLPNLRRPTSLDRENP